MSNEYVWSFAEADDKDKVKFGEEGANLLKMTSLKLPIPRGFIVSTEACTKYYQEGEVISKGIENEIYSKLSELEKITGKKFGDITDPLIVSVRSGSKVSIPGRIDTILNLGLNDDIATSLSISTNNGRFVYDSYRRFIQIFSDVVMKVDKSKFDSILDSVKKENGVQQDTELTIENLELLVKLYKTLYNLEIGARFPTDPKLQLIELLKAVFRSWGTAVTVQEMVFGNIGDNCGTGAVYTRNPLTGESKLYGKFLVNVQGKDVVSGIRTSVSIGHLESIMPDVYYDLVIIAHKLESYFKDMQYIEFTIEKGKLYILQTRNGERTAIAALKIATDLVFEDMITKEEAMMRVEPIYNSFGSNRIKEN